MSLKLCAGGTTGGGAEGAEGAAGRALVGAFLS
jgi:hypothetical protein